MVSRVSPGTHYYAVVSRSDKTRTLFVIASVFKPRVSWHLYMAASTEPSWVEDRFLSNYFGPVDRWRLRLLALAEARALLEAWGGGLLPG
jgi:hypothetical protein